MFALLNQPELPLDRHRRNWRDLDVKPVSARTAAATVTLPPSLDPVWYNDSTCRQERWRRRNAG